jgi:hypothetical protein
MVLTQTGILLVFLLITASAQGGPSREELDIAAKSPAYRTVAERFVATAAARDAGDLEKMLSPAIAARAGKEAVQKVISGQILPFFAEHKDIGRTNTTDGSGNTGFAYYLYSVPKAGQQKPFVIYVVEENGQKVVANILVNHFVEGRHQ